MFFSNAYDVKGHQNLDDVLLPLWSSGAVRVERVSEEVNGRLVEKDRKIYLNDIVTRDGVGKESKRYGVLLCNIDLNEGVAVLYDDKNYSEKQRKIFSDLGDALKKDDYRFKVKTAKEENFA